MILGGIQHLKLNINSSRHSPFIQFPISFFIYNKDLQILTYFYFAYYIYLQQDIDLIEFCLIQFSSFQNFAFSQRYPKKYVKKKCPPFCSKKRPVILVPNFEFEKKIEKNLVFSTKNEANKFNTQINKYVCFAFY